MLYDGLEKSVAVKASALDPRYKFLNFIDSSTTRTEIYQALKEELRDIVVALNAESGPMQASSGSDRSNEGDAAEGADLPFMAQYAGRRPADVQDEVEPRPLSDVQSQIRMAEAQWEMFQQVDPLACNRNPLTWWKKHSGRYAMLMPLVQKYMCIPSTSALAESIFSTTGHVCNKKRSAITSEHLNQIVTLNRNQHIMGE